MRKIVLVSIVLLVLFSGGLAWMAARNRITQNAVIIPGANIKFAVLDGDGKSVTDGVLVTEHSFPLGGARAFRFEYSLKELMQRGRMLYLVPLRPPDYERVVIYGRLPNGEETGKLDIHNAQYWAAVSNSNLPYAFAAVLQAGDPTTTVLGNARVNRTTGNTIVASIELPEEFDALTISEARVAQPDGWCMATVLNATQHPTSDAPGHPVRQVEIADCSLQNGMVIEGLLVDGTQFLAPATIS